MGTRGCGPAGRSLPVQATRIRFFQAQSLRRNKRNSHSRTSGHSGLTVDSGVVTVGKRKSKWKDQAQEQRREQRHAQRALDRFIRQFGRKPESKREWDLLLRMLNLGV